MSSRAARGRAPEPGIRAVLGRELRRLAGRRYLLLGLLFPAIGFGVLLAVFAARVPTELPVAVVDLDHSRLSRTLTRWIDASPTLRVAEHPADAAAGEDLLLRGSVYSVVIVPEGLERSVQRRAPRPVIAYTNGQYLLLGSTIGKELRRVTGTLSAGLELRQREARGEAPSAARAHLEPIPVATRGVYNAEMDYQAFLGLGLLPALLQIFVILLAVQATGEELRHGTGPEWLASAGGSICKAIVGKTLPHVAWWVVVGGAMYGLLFGVMGVPVRGSAWLLALGLLLLVLAVESVGIVLVAAFANLRFAVNLASFYSGPAFAFSGITFPLMAMPWIARIWAGLIPLTFFLRLLTQQATQGAPASTAAAPLAALAAFVVAGATAWPRLKRLLLDPACWGRV